MKKNIKEPKTWDEANSWLFEICEQQKRAARRWRTASIVFAILFIAVTAVQVYINL